jgi:hypothetical protein
MVEEGKNKTIIQDVNCESIASSSVCKKQIVCDQNFQFCATNKIKRQKEIVHEKFKIGCF